MKRLIVIFFIIFTGNLLSFAMESPTDDQLIDYAPIAKPVIGNSYATAFPMGLGSVAENGDQLELIVALDGFNAPVDLYLGLFAPAIDPNELYLFTESGGLQGLNASGLTPWMQNLMASVSTTVLPEIPTELLPHGSYTFYLVVTPADTLSPLWLWSTAFQHSNFIKGIFINTVIEDDLVMTAVDNNDLYYSFFGNKDDDGVVQHFNQLILDQRNSDGNFEHYLTIDFDQLGRPVAMTMPDATRRMTLDYISEAQLSVSIIASDGSTSVVVVDNPFPAVSKRYIEPLQRTITKGNKWLVGGEITTCKDGQVPSVRIKRELDKDFLAAVPELALITPKVSKINDGTDGADYTYFYSLQGLPDYKSWYKTCYVMYAGGVATGLAGAVVGAIDSAYNLFANMFTDIKDGTVDKTAWQVVDHFADKALPAFSFLRKLLDIGKLPTDINNGPCSEKIWHYLNQVQTVSQTVTATLGTKEKLELQKSFTPKPDYSDFASVAAPHLDFTDQCEDDEPPVINDECEIPLGAKYFNYVESDGEVTEYYMLDGHYAGPYMEWYDMSGDRPEHKKCYDAEGQLHGIRRIWFETGEIRQNEYNHGVLLRNTLWFASGNLWQDTYYENAKMTKVITYYDSPGAYKLYQRFNNGFPEGWQESWYENGNQKERVFYIEGKINGEWFLYREDGTLEELRHYKDDWLHGDWTHYEADGISIEYISSYVNGVLQK